jgi:hypothetical protein
MKHNMPEPVGYSEGRSKRKFIAVSACIKKKKRSQINNRIIHQKVLENQEQAKFKTNRRKEIIKIGAEVNERDYKNNTKDALIISIH